MPNKSGGSNIGFLLPVAEFGGVEKVAFNYAKFLKESGWHPHLFVVGGNRAVIPDQFEEVFSTITFFNDVELNSYNNTTDFGSDYFGVGIPQWGKKGNVNLAIGMLLPMDVVVNFHVPSFNSVMAPLRKHGTRTFTSQHLVDRSWIDQPIGSPHQFLAYEHAYDGVLTISRQLLSQFRALGVPEHKLIHIPNAPSYPVPSTLLKQVIKEKELRTSSQKLRVLFIGRFDRQKGLDRLAALTGSCAATGLKIDWRIVGKTILDDYHGYANELHPYLHPPAATVEQLNQHYAWADVLLLPSRFEGVPLTILEAGRFGCVPLATDVGAVGEVIEHGRTGFLFRNTRDEEGLAVDMLQCLARLSSDRNLLGQLARQAAAYYENRTWQSSLQPFLNILPPSQPCIPKTVKFA
jgi:glycosyltransferase involved in cell wall biosynthesis